MEAVTQIKETNMKTKEYFLFESIYPDEAVTLNRQFIRYWHDFIFNDRTGGGSTVLRLYVDEPLDDETYAKLWYMLADLACPEYKLKDYSNKFIALARQRELYHCASSSHDGELLTHDELLNIIRSL